VRGCQVSRGEHSTAADSPGTAATSYNPPVAEDQGKEEEKFDFTSEGEGYISLDEARVLALQTASSAPGDYGRSFRGVTMVFEVSSLEETDDFYEVTLSFRPQGNFDGTPGQEQFVVGKEGTVAVRQVLSHPTQTSASSAGTAGNRGGFPILPVAIGLVIVGIIAAVGAVVVLMSSGGDSVPIAAVLPTETPAPTQPPAPTETLAPTETPAATPTFTPMPTYTPYPSFTPAPTYTPYPTPTYAPTPTFTPMPTYRPTPTAVPPSFTNKWGQTCVRASDGSAVTAWIDGEQMAATNASGGEYNLLIDQGFSSFAGKLVRFKVSGMEAQQTAIWVQGGGEVLNLTVDAGSSRQGIPTPLSLGPNQFRNWPIGVLAQRVPPHVFVGTVSIC
jgi:hypothetical protein